MEFFKRNPAAPASTAASTYSSVSNVVKMMILPGARLAIRRWVAANPSVAPRCAIPWRFVLVGALSVIAALPLIAIQSLLSMLLRSFAVPVAICLLGCVVGVATVTSTALRPLSYVLPQAINTPALNLGSSAIAESGSLTLGDALPVLGTAVGLAVIIVALSLVAIRAIKLW